MNSDFRTFLGIVLLLTFILLFFLLIRQVFLKGVTHFKLLKELYPKELSNVNSYFQMMWISNSSILDFKIMIWFWAPFYYDLFSSNNFTPQMLEYHKRLLKSNKKIVFLLILFMCNVILIGLVAKFAGSAVK